jgi:hypothetical protein
MVVASSLGGLTEPARSADFVTRRHAYVRGEQVTVQVSLEAGIDAVRFDVSGRLPQIMKAQPGTSTPGGPKGPVASYTFDTTLLRAGDYEVRAQPMRNGREVGAPMDFALAIAPTPNPQRFPVWYWGTASPHNLAWWKGRGFNGYRLPSVTDPDLSRIPETEIALEESTRMGFDVAVTMTPLNSVPLREAAASEGRNPKVYPRHPLVLDHARKTPQSWLNRFKDYPSFKSTLLSTEYQMPPIDSKLWESLVRQESGLKPEEMPKQEWFPNEKNVYIDASKLPAHLQPKNGIIEDNNAIYRYLQWWWQRGHGTSVLNEEMAKVIKAQRPDVITWHDPYRLAAVRKSHSGLDMISTWTYGHPDIKRLSYTTVLQAAARPEKQKVMQTITLWIYARYVVPIRNSTADLQNDYAGQDENFMQGPDYTREAIWLVLSQRPDVLGFYSAGAKNPDNTNLDPTNASPITHDAIGEVSRHLIEPYGPTILNTQREKPRVAVLMSASSIWFNGSRGWSNEVIMPFISLLMMNHVPFEVVLDDDILEGRLNNYDALVIPNGEVLLRGVHQRITNFARDGKKVIAARSLVAEIPGAQKTDFDFSFLNKLDGTALAEGRAITAEDARTRMEKFADDLKPLVAGLQGMATAGSKRVVTNSLQSGDVQYVFAINDDKTYGPRFGKWKLFQELGVTQEADVQIANAAPKAIYDALARREITATSQGDNASIKTSLPASQGKLLAVLPEKIGKVEVILPPQTERGKKVELRVRVLGVSGKPVVGAVPLRIQVLDATNRSNEYTRFASTASDGSGFTMPLIPALNDQTGAWTITVTDWLSGQQTVQKLVIK